MMLRIDYQIFGYRRVKIKKEDTKTVAALLLKEGITLKICNEMFTVREDEFSKISRILEPRVKLNSSNMLGLRGFLSRNRYRVGALLGILISIFLFFFFSSCVSDVRIEGVGDINEEKIKEELSSVGFGVGTRWSATDKNDIEVKMLKSSECVSWININRRGSVAYVKVIDKNTHKEEDTPVGYANVVAKSDGIIEEITVKRGVAMVKKGDSVKCGQILISGAFPSESGGGFCYAEGEVFARVSDIISVSVGESRTEKVELGRNLSETRLKILNFSVNIFKLYRNPLSECDIIQKESNLSFFGRRLPISVLRTYSVDTATEEILLSKDEMTRLASDALKSSLSDRLRLATLLKIKTDGAFDGDKYTMSAEIVLNENIAMAKEFEFSQK